MVILKGLPLLVAKISNSRLVPEHYEQREVWHKPTGGTAPLWIRKLVRGDKKFWQPEGDDICVTLPVHTKDEETDSHSLHCKVGVRHQVVEVPHNEWYDIGEAPMYVLDIRA